MEGKIKLCHTRDSCPTVEEIIIDGKIAGLKVTDDDGGQFDFSAEALEWLFAEVETYKERFPQVNKIEFEDDNEEVILTLFFEDIEMLKKRAKEKGLV